MALGARVAASPSDLTRCLRVEPEPFGAASGSAAWQPPSLTACPKPRQARQVSTSRHAVAVCNKRRPQMHRRLTQ